MRQKVGARFTSPPVHRPILVNRAPTCCDFYVLHQSFRHQLGQVQHFDVSAAGVDASAQVHQAAGVICYHDCRAGAFGVVQFVVQQALGNCGVLD